MKWLQRGSRNESRAQSTILAPPKRLHAPKPVLLIPVAAHADCAN